MRIIRLVIVTVVLISAVAVLAQDEPATLEEDNGLVTIESQQSVDDTVTSLEAILAEAGFAVPLILDHSANAARVDLELPPTKLIIFGNPNAGTPLIQAQRTIGLDLPQKMLVWEDDDGTVYITYNDPMFLARRHGIEEMDERLTNISNALANFAEAGATTPPVATEETSG
jgi:uncharacterized protein (DUF302 family)